MRHISLAMLVVATSSSVHPASVASKDPFVGKWTLDVARSTIVDDMKVQALGPNKYAFNFEGAPTETVVADGTDQPGLPGTTLAVKAADAHSLTVVRKQDGRIILSAAWKLSADGRTLRDSFTSIQSDGSKATTDYVYRRISGTSGFAGAWESTTPPVGLKLELAIQPYGNKGLRFVSPGSDKSVIFDGREHPAAGMTGVTLSGRRGALRSLQYTEKNGGKIERVRQFELSSNGRRLTETIHVDGQATPTMFVFERE